MTKLMWALVQGMDQPAIARLFQENLAGEITVPQNNKTKE
jgi:hypothetical protein